MKKYHKPMMETAYIWAKESYCKRKQVGAVLAKNGRILSVGYNGTTTGSDNKCEQIVFDKIKVCPSCEKRDIRDKDELKYCTSCNTKKFECELKVIELPRLVTKSSVIHAEANAIAFAGLNGIKTKGCTMYVTLSPCIECSKILIQHGIKKVYYAESYKGDEGVKFLRENGVKVKHLNKF